MLEISTFFAKILFFPLFLTFNSQKLTLCEENSQCSYGFECKSHFYYNKPICKAKNSQLLTKLTPLLIKGYSSGLGIDENMTKLLLAVSKRESNNAWWENHFIKSDITAIRKSSKRLNLYLPPDSKHGTYGLFGQNSVLFLNHLPNDYSPEILMHPFFAILAYKTSADKAYLKLKKGVVCNGKKYHGRYKNKPTLSDIHNAVSGGKICPRSHNDKREKWLRNNIPFIYTTHYTPNLETINERSKF